MLSTSTPDTTPLGESVTDTDPTSSAQQDLVTAPDLPILAATSQTLPSSIATNSEDAAIGTADGASEHRADVEGCIEAGGDLSGPLDPPAPTLVDSGSLSDVSPLGLSPAQAEEQREVSALRAQVQALHTALDERGFELAGARQAHRSDVAMIGQALLKEAKDRGWCSEYDDVVTELNRSLSISLPERMRDYTVHVSLTITLTTIRARDEDSARQRAECIVRRLEREVDQMEGISTSDWEHSSCYSVDED